MGWRLAAGDSPKIRSVCNWAQWRMVTRAVTMVGRLVVNNAEMHTCYLLHVFESLNFEQCSQCRYAHRVGLAPGMPCNL